jgi:hypothetical protein
MGNALPFVNLGTGRTAKALSAGRYGTCALLDDDSAKCWGLGLYANPGDPNDNIGDEPGEMGDDLAPVALGAGRKAIAVGLSYYGACIARDDRTFRCTDTSGFNGDLPAPSSGATVTRLFPGRYPIGLFDDGSMREVIPPNEPAGRFNGQTKVTIAAGHSQGGCALIVGGTVECWGTSKTADFPPELLGGRGLAMAELNQACGITSAGVVRCWGSTVPGTTGSGTSAVVALGAPATAIASGNAHFCALTDAGDVKCWAFGTQVGSAVGAAVHTSTRWDPVDLGERTF